MQHLQIRMFFLREPFVHPRTKFCILLKENADIGGVIES